MLRRSAPVLLLLAGLAVPATADDRPEPRPIAASVDRVVANTFVGSGQASPSGFDRASFKLHQRKKEKFFSATNMLMGAGLFGSAVADLETTFTCLGTTGETRTPLPGGSTYVETRWCYEGNSFFRPLINSGRASSYGGKALFNVPVWVGSHYLRRSSHRTVRVIGWVVPVVAIGVQTKLAIDNVRTTNFVRTGR
jgi:hypothetical protein